MQHRDQTRCVRDAELLTSSAGPNCAAQHFSAPFECLTTDMQSNDGAEEAAQRSRAGAPCAGRERALRSSGAGVNSTILNEQLTIAKAM
jgi:hypothetical protein